MKKFALLLILTVTAFFAQAQNLHITVFGGFSNYQGDLQEKRFTLSQAHTAFGAGAAYEITDKIFIRANATFGKISGDDKLSSKNAIRNLNFTSSITDLHLGAEYYILNPYESSLSPYVFAGVSLFSFRPYTNDTLGRKVYLQPLSTEGQGFYKDRKVYKLSQLSIPFGGGVKFSVSDNVRIGFEIGLRKTNTDYLDDVSTNYIDETILLVNRGQQAVDMAFRGKELKTGLNYPADGMQRGSPKVKDWYYFSGLTLSFRINNTGGSGGGLKGGGRYKTGCPTNVY